MALNVAERSRRIRWDRRSVNLTEGIYTGDLSDPADGARVPRCKVCGMPSTPDRQLLAGVWMIGSYRMSLVLCDRELPPFDPRSGDPLTA